MNTARETVAAIVAGRTSARAEVEAAIARIEAGDGAINAVVVRDFDRARAAADDADRRVMAGERTPLLGLPMTVKESFDVAGLPTSWGFVEHRDYVPTSDAAAVKRLKTAGAIILGKTNVPPALADLQSDNPVYGRTSNPHDHSRVAGGSSGGAAAALAAGFVALELGSDIGGSIRVPAAFNGVWGHKPTYAALSSEGHHFPRTDGARAALAVIGPLARDGDDLALALDILTSQPLARPATRGVGDWRVLVLDSHPAARVAAPIRAALDSLADAFGLAGASVDRASPLLPDLAAQHRHYMHMLNIALTRGVAAGDRPAPTLAEWFDLNDHQARNRRQWNRLFADYDAVIAPALGVTAFPHDPTPLADRLLTIDGEATRFGAQFAFPGLATFPMLPATSVPVGTDPEGLPIGVQVIADTLADHTAIAVAQAAHALMRT
ncbi:amidase family protein [Sphingomonas sp.]|uniref:amidase family protein n=1 Tax=Sphingomonas sp. TaxID=28214 RepID=UPI002B9834AC|nr:amidase family protein [Sphingomonas sp.]HWK37244.1 amidase family protein [Sphingomonas sp.]